MSSATPSRWIRNWLATVCAFILAMILIGGITRLTGSGLSITDWKPIMGAIPPLNDVQWDETFARYQSTPQYRQVNSSMTLTEFKSIFFWEYIHRLLGRLMALTLLLPALFFYFQKKISRRIFLRAMGGFVLGGLQGALGWFMVKSGLVDRPSVSHFRLAAHLVLAFFILAYFVWLTLDVSTTDRPEIPESRSFSRAILPLFRFFRAALLLQIIYGAFVAGLKAGWGFNTFPLMAGKWIPRNVAAQSPFWENLFWNPVMIQWIHRWLGMGVLLSGIALLARAWRKRREVMGSDPVARALTRLGTMTVIQFLLGVATLLMTVPLPLAILHQFGAAFLVILLTAVTHSIHRTAPASVRT